MAKQQNFTRYFEFSSGKSNKFWEICLDGTEVTVRYGRIGSDGRTNTKSFDDAAQAQAHAEKLIEEKTGKGYSETNEEFSRTKSDFEQQLREDPDDLETLTVFADFLSEHNDPRGEFINVQLALEDEERTPKQRKELQKREQELLKAHQEKWLGPLAKLLIHNNPSVDGVEDYDRRRPNYEYRIARGYLHTLDIAWLHAPMAEMLRDAEEASLLRELLIGTVAEDDWPEEVVGEDSEYDRSDHIEPLKNAKLDSLRKLQIGSEIDMDLHVTQEYGPDCHVYLSDAVDVALRAPRLEELHLLCKSFDIDKLFANKKLTRLKVLRIYHMGSRRRDNNEYPLETLARNKTFGNLTHLQFHPHQSEYGVDSFLPLEGIKALVKSKHLKKLTHLQLRLTTMGDDGCEVIVKSGILKRLKWLDLRHGCITDVGAVILAECPDIKNLQHLDLSRNGLTEDGIAVLTAAGVPVIASNQLTPQQLGERVYLNDGDFE